MRRRGSSKTDHETRRIRQHRGGIAAFRGHTYEEFFATYRLLLAVRGQLDGRRVRAALQLKNCHVDDWVEDDAIERRFFQLKNSKAQTWGAVRGAFEAQARDRPRGRKMSLNLVIPAKSTRKRLLAARRRPANVRVQLFPSFAAPADYIRRNGVARAALEQACVLPLPTNSDLEVLWKETAFGWTNIRKPGAFVDTTRLVEALADQKHVPLVFRWEPTGISGGRTDSAPSAHVLAPRPPRDVLLFGALWFQRENVL